MRCCSYNTQVKMGYLCGFEICIGFWCVTSYFSIMLRLYLPASQWTAVCNSNFKVQVILSPHFPFLQRYLMCLTGFQDVELFHYEKIEAVVGQDITLPCFVKNSTNLKVVNAEWSKRENEIQKLALYTPGFGTNIFRPNITIQTVNNDDNNFVGSYLKLHNVEKGNSGIYICDVATFPLGSIRYETELKIKGKADMHTLYIPQPRLFNMWITFSD